MEVVESRGCNSRHQVGDKFIFDGAGNPLTKHNPVKICIFALNAATGLIFATGELFYAGVDPNERRPPPPRFLCDVMLGRLARWLRALGHNTAYDHAADDPALLRRAVRERRILVTRDTRLSLTPRAPHIVLLHANDTPSQLRELVDMLGIARHPGLLTRCIVCNTRLRAAKADQVEARVPEYVRSTQGVFRDCPGCGRIYWAGTHRQGILAALESALPGVTGQPGNLTGETPGSHDSGPHE